MEIKISLPGVNFIRVNIKNNHCFEVLRFCNRSKPSGQLLRTKQKCILRKVMRDPAFSEAKSSSLNVNSKGSVRSVQGSLQWNSPSQSHIKGLPEISMGLDRGREIHTGNPSLGPARGGGEEGPRKTSCLLFHIVSLYYYKTLQTISNLHA